MGLNSNEVNASILDIPMRPNGAGLCSIGTESCGLCPNCLQRARVMVASMAIDAQRRRGKTMNSPAARHHARNRTLRMLCALGLLPEEMEEEDKASIHKWVEYCEKMHEMGMRGNLK